MNKIVCDVSLTNYLDKDIKVLIAKKFANIPYGFKIKQITYLENGQLSFSGNGWNKETNKIEDFVVWFFLTLFIKKCNILYMNEKEI